MTPLRALGVSPCQINVLNECLLLRGCRLFFPLAHASLTVQDTALVSNFRSVSISSVCCVWREAGVEARFFALKPVVQRRFWKALPPPSELPWHLGKIQEGRKPAAVSTRVSFC